jgi:hypothetical protein
MRFVDWSWDGGLAKAAAASRTDAKGSPIFPRTVKERWHTEKEEKLRTIKLIDRLSTSSHELMGISGHCLFSEGHRSIAQMVHRAKRRARNNLQNARGIGKNRRTAFPESRADDSSFDASVGL